jgi:phage replication initiation protein
MSINLSIHENAAKGNDHGAVKPPFSNTGAERTKQTGLKARCDWVSVTFKNVSEREIIEDILLLDRDDFVEMDRGMYGYPQSLRFGNIVVLYGGRKEMGVHISMAGEGCREYENIGRVPWSVLFRVMLATDAQFSRLDIALDDHVGYWTIDKVVNKVKRNELVSRFKSAKRIEQVKIGDGTTSGETVYFGSSTSLIIIRMYNKALEQLGCEGIDPVTIPETWNRTEIQARKERAQSIAGLIANGVEVGAIVKGILKYYMRFVVKPKGGDTNKRRWKTAQWWERFLDEIEPIRLSEQNEMDTTIEKRLVWMKWQVAPSLAAVIRAMDGEMTAIYELIRDGMNRLKPRDIAMIKQYQENVKTAG